MTNVPNVVVKAMYTPSLNNLNFKYKTKEKILKSTAHMFDYFGKEKKQALYMFDYYDGTLTKDEHMNIILENGKYATDEDISKRKKQYEKYIQNSNIYKLVISFPSGYLEQNTNIKQFEQDLVKHVIPIFLKKCGFVDIKKMSYQVALHTDTDNLHFHFSFVEKNPNYCKYGKKINYRVKGELSQYEINFLKNEVEHYINKQKIYTPLLKETNQEIDELKKYFNPKEQNYLLKDKDDLMLEYNILKLGRLISEQRGESSRRIKYNSINNQQIKNMTKQIKSYLFSSKNPELEDDYNNFKISLNKINLYFKTISKDNNLKECLDNNDLINSKQEYIDNYVYNAIVNKAYSSYKYKSRQTIHENDVIEEIIYKEYLKSKKNSRYNVLKNYLSQTSNSLKYQNKYKINQAVKSINNELEDAQKEFHKLFEENSKEIKE
jgi:hypothetical protein